MANTVKRNESSPSVKRGGSIGPALNPNGLQQGRKKGLYLDGNVALAEYESEWSKFFDDPKKVQRFSQPVRSRL
jgi:hypothetical protein